MDSDDGQWSEGLVSAARLVAAATHSLVESANALVQGQSSEDKLISAAKQVASSTAQLLVACKVKADPDSKSTQRLQVRRCPNMEMIVWHLNCLLHLRSQPREYSITFNLSKVYLNLIQFNPTSGGWQCCEKSNWQLGQGCTASHCSRRRAQPCR